jgi:guanyl-specific ribonuclease Sa
MRRLSVFALLLLLTAALLFARSSRKRVRNEDARQDVAAAVARRMGEYRTVVKGPHGEAVDLSATLRRIAEGKTLRQAGFPSHDGDGTTFLNLRDRRAGRRPLADRPRGYYVEFVVPPGAGYRWPGPERLIAGRGGDGWFSPDHYDPDTIVALGPKR